MAAFTLMTKRRTDCLSNGFRCTANAPPAPWPEGPSAKRDDGGVIRPDTNRRTQSNYHPEHHLPLTWTTHRKLPDEVRPFCHFDRGRLIAFQGHPQPETELNRLRHGRARWARATLHQP